jgi:hypothetical protein
MLRRTSKAAKRMIYDHSEYARRLAREFIDAAARQR